MNSQNKNKSERIKLICDYLDKLYPSPPIPLDHINIFTLLIAVVLSAQSTDKKVNEISPKLFKLASDPYSMKDLGQPNILELIKQIGLSKTKSRNIYRLSQIIIEKHNGKVPDNFDDLESLPGVGHKTASVVMAQAYGIPTFPVDTHIHRLAQRWELTNGKSVIQTEKDLKILFPKSIWNKLHLQIIFYGREHCTARGCNGMTCDLCKLLFPNRNEPILWIKP